MYAGIATAHTNNNLGIAGVSWGSRYLAYRCGDNSMIYLNMAISAVVNAVSKSASAIIFGFGSSSFSTSFNNTIQYAWQSGCVLIGPAGTYSSGQIRYPAGYDNVIAVTASDQNDYLTSNANYGDWIDLAAPGSNIFTTTISGYGLAYTTAASTACVAGQVLLLKSMYPNLTNAQIVAKIFESCDSMPDPLYAQGMLGYGRINVFKSLRQLSGIEDNSLLNISGFTISISPNPFSSHTAIRFTLPASNQASLQIYDVTGRLIKSFSAVSDRRSAESRLVWNGKDNNGNTVKSGVYFITLKTDDKSVTSRIIKIN
ncbi:MAG: S8 family peptidase [Candidatus Latescibacteria bacterium]|nr:S8 family peptidase [Candidatus Latescibacterota bacterium]